MASRRPTWRSELPEGWAKRAHAILADRGITDFEGIAAATPSISFTPYPSSSNTLILFIRGQGVADSGQITLDSSGPKLLTPLMQG